MKKCVLGDFEQLWFLTQMNPWPPLATILANFTSRWGDRDPYSTLLKGRQQTLCLEDSNEQINLPSVRPVVVVDLLH